MTDAETCGHGTAVTLIIPRGVGRERTLSSIEQSEASNSTSLAISEPLDPFCCETAAWDTLSQSVADTHHGSDVVILPPGTMVHGDWLDRLRSAAYSDDKVGSASPFTDGQGVTGFPEGGVAGAAVDRAIRDLNCAKRLPLSAPGHIGTYYRQDYLDDHRSGRSTTYWKHLLAGDVYVCKGEITPNIQPAPASRPNPSRVLRRNLGLGLLTGSGPLMLIVSHSWGGGTERYAQELAEPLRREGVRVIFLRSEGPDAVRLEGQHAGTTVNLVYEVRTEYHALLAAIRWLKVDHVHVNHLIGHGPTTRQLIADLNLPYDVTLVDQYLFCPRIHMFDEHGQFCGEPDADGCDSCLATRGDIFRWRGGADIRRWRRDNDDFVGKARRVYLIHAEMGERARRYLPSARLDIKPPAEVLTSARPVSVPWAPGDTLRVALIGSIMPHKGVSVLLGCATDAVRRRLPIEYRVIGRCDRADEFAALGNVHETGPYKEQELFDRLAEQACHCALFVSTVPETHSYTLSAAMAGGLYALGLDIGAQGARIRECSWGEVLPFHSQPTEINDRLLAARERLTRPRRQPLEMIQYESILRDYYELDLANGG